MGVKMSIRLDPRFRSTLEGISSGAMDITDVANFVNVHPTYYIDLLSNWLIGQKYIPIRIAIYNYATGCMVTTPVKTGNARRNWHIISSNSSVSGEYVDLRALPVSAGEAEAQMTTALWKEAVQAVGKKEGHSKSARSNLAVVNKTPYIGKLEARKGMTAEGLARMLGSMEVSTEQMELEENT